MQFKIGIFLILSPGEKIFKLHPASHPNKIAFYKINSYRFKYDMSYSLEIIIQAQWRDRTRLMGNYGTNRPKVVIEKYIKKIGLQFFC